MQRIDSFLNYLVTVVVSRADSPAINEKETIRTVLTVIRTAWCQQLEGTFLFHISPS